MRMLLLLSGVLAVSAVGCGGKPDCNEAAKAWCERAKACGGNPTADCESIVANSCNAAAPASCKGSVDASECVSAASNEACGNVLAGLAPSCTLSCK
jgi:hypothetical protein